MAAAARHVAAGHVRDDGDRHVLADQVGVLGDVALAVLVAVERTGLPAVDAVGRVVDHRKRLRVGRREAVAVDRDHPAEDRHRLAAQRGGVEAAPAQVGDRALRAFG